VILIGLPNIVSVAINVAINVAMDSIKMSFYKFTPNDGVQQFGTTMAGCWCVQVFKSSQKKLFLDEVWVVLTPCDSLKKELTSSNGCTVARATLDDLANYMDICQSYAKACVFLLSSQRWDNVITLVYKET